MGAIGAALTWLGYNSVVSLTMNPVSHYYLFLWLGIVPYRHFQDVHWDREQRGSMVKSNEAQAENWYNRVTGRYRSYDNDVGNVGVFEKLNAKMGGKNMTTRKDDPDRLHD